MTLVYASKNNEWCNTYSKCTLKSGTQWGGSFYRKSIHGTATKVGGEFSTVKVNNLPTMPKTAQKGDFTFTYTGDANASETICISNKRPSSVQITGCPENMIDYDKAKDIFTCRIKKEDGGCEISSIGGAKVDENTCTASIDISPSSCPAGYNKKASNAQNPLAKVQEEQVG